MYKDIFTFVSNETERAKPLGNPSLIAFLHGTSLSMISSVPAHSLHRATEDVTAILLTCKMYLVDAWYYSALAQVNVGRLFPLPSRSIQRKKAGLPFQRSSVRVRRHVP